MKAGHKIIYHCGENSSHRLLLVRTGSYSDSWKWYVYSEATGQIIDRSTRETGIDQAEHAGQLSALRNGVSPVLHDKMEIPA